MDKIIGILIVLLIISTGVAAIGLSPGKATISYKPGKTFNGTVRIFNDQSKDFTGQLYVSGALKNSVTLSTYDVIFTSEDEFKDIKYSITVPTLPDSGRHLGKIHVQERASPISGSSNIIPTIDLISRLVIDVPFQGRYITAQVKADDVASGEDVFTYVNVKNVGDSPIETLLIGIDILNPKGRSIASSRIEHGLLAPKQREEFRSQFSSGLFREGEYTVNATFGYDGTNRSFYDTFAVGRLLKITDIYVNNFTLGGIAKITVAVKNVGNRPLSNVWSQLRINDQLKIRTSMQSPEYGLSEGEEKDLEMFWDTQGFSQGEYFGELKVRFNDDIITKRLKMDLTSEGLDMSLVTGNIVEDVPKSDGVYVQMAAIILIIIILVTIAIFIHFKVHGNVREK